MKSYHSLFGKEANKYHLMFLEKKKTFVSTKLKRKLLLVEKKKISSGVGILDILNFFSATAIPIVLTEWVVEKLVQDISPSLPEKVLNLQFWNAYKNSQTFKRCLFSWFFFRVIIYVIVFYSIHAINFPKNNWTYFQ